MSKISQKNLFFRFKKYIADNDLIRAGDKVVVACSGGPDSIALLYLLNKAAKNLNLEIFVAHFNHRLRGRESDKDELFVSNVADKLGIDFIAGSANKTIRSEEEARVERYKFLENVMVGKDAKLLAIAHNLEDQAETMMLNIIRGTGIRGLYSLRSKRGHIIRPLLFAKKIELLSFLEEESIPFRTDKSNLDLVYTRNIIRHKILPEIEKINPSYTESFARLAAISSEADRFIVSYSKEILEKIAHNENGVIKISKKEINSLSPILAKEIIRLLAESAGITKDLTENQVAQVAEMIRKNIGGKQKIIQGRLKIELKADKIVISNLKGVL